jgi:hypothetical protein
MTKDEALKIPELCIEVTPLVEDAFYAFRDIDDKELQERLDRLPDDYVSGDAKTDELMEKFDRDIESAENARMRFMQGTPTERFAAMNAALQMIENLEKYGVPCAEWIFT